MSHAKLYIGLDAGGSKTALCAVLGEGQEPFTLTGPAANLQRLGLKTTAQVLSDLILEAHAHFPEATLEGVCAGIAGAGRPADQEALAARVREALRPHEPHRLHILHDGAIALQGAFEGGSGIIIIAGTGSIVLAQTKEGRELRVGGWGYLLGDQGSGHALGLEGLRAIAIALDGGPATSLQAMLAGRHGLTNQEDLLQAIYQEGWPVQRMAPLVVEAATQGDTQAERIVAEQARALARQVEWLIDGAPPITPRVALLGGLTQEPYYRRALGEAILTALPGWQLQEPAHPPVMGALHLAKEIA